MFALVCVLRVDPTERTDDAVQRCFRDFDKLIETKEKT